MHLAHSGLDDQYWRHWGIAAEPICIRTANTSGLLAKRTTLLIKVLGLIEVRVCAPFAEESAFILLPSSSRMSSLLHAFSSGPGRYSVLAGPNSGQ